MKEIAKEMGISRQKLYQWIKGKSRLNENQLVYIKKCLTGTIFGFIIFTMLHSCLYYILSLGDKSRLIVKFFKEKVDLLLTFSFCLVNIIKNICSRKLNLNSSGELGFFII